MNRNVLTILGGALALGLAGTASAATNLAVNPGFEDLDNDGSRGDGWGTFVNADFNAFFGGNSHASFYGDNPENNGGVFQQGITGVAGQEYQFDLLDTRIEQNWDANFRFGFEFYAADDSTLLQDSTLIADTGARLALAGGGSVDGAVFSMRAVAPVGTAFVRPVIKFDTVNPNHFFTPQANAFVFDAFVSATPGPGSNLLKNPLFEEDVNGNGFTNDVWRTFGNAEINTVFGSNTGTSLYADRAGNSGGVYQPSILADPGTNYQFTLPDVRIESAFDARLRYGIEFYAGNDATKISEVLQTVPSGTTGDGLTFTVSAVAPAGAVFARPIVLFDNVNPAYAGQPQANAFVFDASLIEVVSATPGDFSGDGRVDGADLSLLLANWGSAVPPAPSGWVGSAPTSPAVDADELSALLSSWGFGTATAVPEPTCAAMAAISLAMLCGRRRNA